MYYFDIQSKIEMLPENAKQELSDFAEFLFSKYYKPLKKQLSDSEYKESSEFKVSVRNSDKEVGFMKNYSFRKVRKLLSSVQGNISSDIFHDREERL